MGLERSEEGLKKNKLNMWAECDFERIKYRDEILGGGFHGGSFLGQWPSREGNENQR